MPSRSDRIFAHVANDVDTIVILNARSHWIDSTFVYVSEVTRGGYGGCGAILRRGERPLLVVSARKARRRRIATSPCMRPSPRKRKS